MHLNSYIFGIWILSASEFLPYSCQDLLLPPDDLVIPAGVVDVEFVTEPVAEPDWSIGEPTGMIAWACESSV